MLSYFKYLAILCFFLVAVGAFFAGVYFRSFAADKVIRQHVMNDQAKIFDDFTKNIWCKYERSFSALADKPAKSWQEDPTFSKFVRVSKNLFIASNNFKIIFYLPNKEQLFSTNETEIHFFDDAKDRKGFSTAFQGKNNSVLVPSMGYHENNELKKGSFVQSFLLIDASKCAEQELTPGLKPNKIIVEAYNDVTMPWNELYLFQILISAGIVGIFMLLYLVLFVTSKKAEKIINKQHEDKLKLEKAKASAEAQNQQKSMFLANVSHELRTPLNAIIGFSDIIKDEVMGPVGHPQYKEYINDINSSGIHLLSLINDILDYSKAEARKLEVEFIDIDLTKISHSCMRLVEPRAKDAKVNLVENVPEKHVVLSADPKRMKQVILNLLSNAVKFTQEGGQVTLTIEEHQLDGNVVLIVSDNGIGIAAKDISKALAPFGQIDSSLSRKYEGTGLGLPLTKKLTEIMGGKFDIRSEVGLGTTIILTFPLVVQSTEDVHNNF